MASYVCITTYDVKLMKLRNGERISYLCSIEEIYDCHCARLSTSNGECCQP